MELGKLFVGGISWDTSEERLREYFQTFGEVLEAVIMKDRTTGRARGFGFIVFADPTVAERVVKEKHVINGRAVEAKKAVPREDQHILNKNNGSVQGSPGHARTKKIFVGGLASTVTESDFKEYFDQFGTITDVVVMYDHNTQRPRGFGFITYDSEEAVDRVLLKTFHELNHKLVEVKRAVPKELSPAPTRNHLSGYNYGTSRVSSFLNAYTPGYNPNSLGGYGLRMDSQISPMAASRSAYTSYNSSTYGLGPTIEPGMYVNYGVNSSFSSNLSYGRALSPSYSGSFNRYGHTVGYGGAGVTAPTATSGNHNMWGNASVNYATNSGNSDFLSSGGRNKFGIIGPIGNSSPNLGHSGGTTSTYNNFTYSNAENSFRSGGVMNAINNANRMISTSPYSATDGQHDKVFGHFDRGGPGGSFHGDATWLSSSSDLEGGSLPVDYGLVNAASDVTAKNSVGYVGGYSVNNTNRGIAT